MGASRVDPEEALVQFKTFETRLKYTPHPLGGFLVTRRRSLAIAITYNTTVHALIPRVPLLSLRSA